MKNRSQEKKKKGGGGRDAANNEVVPTAGAATNGHQKRGRVTLEFAHTESLINRRRDETERNESNGSKEVGTWERVFFFFPARIFSLVAGRLTAA